MNKTKIEWTDYTWNPVTGCKRGCFYCYARNINRRFKDCSFNDIGFHPNRLDKPLKIKKPSKIFVGSMCDLFADWTPSEYVDKILDIVKQCPQHTFQFLTKDANNYHHFKFSDNCWLGETITAWADLVYGVSPFGSCQNRIRFVSFEPLLSSINISKIYPHDWIIMGAMTGSAYRKKYAPKVKWIEDILKQADKLKIPVFMKSNLKGVWKGKLRQEFPESK